MSFGKKSETKRDKCNANLFAHSSGNVSVSLAGRADGRAELDSSSTTQEPQTLDNSHISSTAKVSFLSNWQTYTF